MTIAKVRTIISALSLLTLVLCLVAQSTWVSILMIVVCLFCALALLWRNLPLLSDLEEDNPKLRTVRFVTAFNSLCFLSIAVLMVLVATETVTLTEESESVIVSVIFSIVILGLGNICPKLPFTRHTGLRLPWTVADESTWILAHRILGYTAIPFGVCNLIVMFSAQSADYRAGFSIGIFLLWVGIASIVSAHYFYRGGVI